MARPKANRRQVDIKAVIGNLRLPEKEGFPLDSYVSSIERSMARTCEEHFAEDAGFPARP